MTRKSEAPSDTPAIRCAIYTRKSTEEGLDQDFNSLDAQRESAEAFIRSQKHEGWICLPDRYDDAGFTGGNMDRPALKRLMKDIEAGRIDSVVVYKVDRLSRSLMDFTKMVDVFERHKVSFVSVTQQLNTTTSMGRLTLNVLLSFAQFEREIISERTRDKMAAARRKGKYVGGAPVLGYDIDRSASRLLVNEREAVRVREIFLQYLKNGSLIPTIAELDRRGWTTKKWTTKDGRVRGGNKFNKNSLHGLLTNQVYLGKVEYRGEVFDAEHPGIVDPEVFQQVRNQLSLNRTDQGRNSRKAVGALLRGLLRCVPCGCGMNHTHSTKHGNKRYRYYVCHQAQKRGWGTCPSKAIPAGEIERYVIDQIRGMDWDPGLIAETTNQVTEQGAIALARLLSEQKLIQRGLAFKDSEIRRLAIATSGRRPDPADLAELADVQDQVRLDQTRLAEIRDEIAVLQTNSLKHNEIASALNAFDPVWDGFTPQERTRFLQLVIDRIDYDGKEGTLAITFKPTGLQPRQSEFHLEEIPV